MSEKLALRNHTRMSFVQQDSYGSTRCTQWSADGLQGWGNTPFLEEQFIRMLGTQKKKKEGEELQKEGDDEAQALDNALVEIMGHLGEDLVQLRGAEAMEGYVCDQFYASIQFLNKGMHSTFDSSSVLQ